jgi:hypothetical protein
MLHRIEDLATSATVGGIMSEPHTPSAEHNRQDTQERATPQVLLALIEHGSRPVAILVIGLCIITWLFFARGPLLQLLSETEAFKFGSFEMRLKKAASSANLGAELQRLQELTHEQLQVFLIVGKKRGHISYFGEELTEENLRALERAGLLAEVRQQPEGGLWWRVSQEGHRLHELIFTQLLFSIRQSATL